MGKQKTCQEKDYFDIRAHIFNNNTVMPQSVLLPIMGGTGNNPGLANNGGQEFHHQNYEGDIDEKNFENCGDCCCNYDNNGGDGVCHKKYGKPTLYTKIIQNR